MSAEYEDMMHINLVVDPCVVVFEAVKTETIIPISISHSSTVSVF
jgi:hypothetical protein